MDNDKKVILVVDDDAAHARSVCALLDAEGFETQYATEGERGRALLESGHYDLLILDLDMPDLPGVEILRHLRQRTASPMRTSTLEPATHGSNPLDLHAIEHIPGQMSSPELVDTRTIVVSGETDLGKVAPILRLGAFDYLPKPYAPERLIACVRNALDHQRLTRENATLAAEAEARNALHRFLVNASEDLIYILDADGRFSYLNDRLENVFGYQAQALTGRPWRELLSEPYAGELQYRVNERRTHDRATRHLHFDFQDSAGQQRIIELSATGLYDTDEAGAFKGTYGVLRDVTDARRMARELVSSQAKFRALFMNSPDAVFISRVADGTIVERNENFAGIIARLGIAQADDDLAIFGTEDVRAQFIDDLIESPERQQRVIEKDVDGERRYFEITSRLLDMEGAPTVLSTVRDLTLEKQAEQDRLQHESQLQQASRMEAIGQLAGGIAHDFNNILASIIGYAELVQVSADRIATDRVRTYLKEVISAGQRARDLISQMLTFTSARRGDVTRLNVSDSIDDVSRMLRAAIPSNIEITTHLAADLPLVRIDAVQLQQIILNLMINARDAIKGTGRIDVSVGALEAHGRCVSCGETFDGRYVVMTISDTGAGIPSDILPRIFDMYMTTRAPGEGTGMGLWLIHTLLHEYGGHVLVDSDVGKGASFAIHLPTAETDRDADDQDDHVAAPRTDGPILVIDDDAMVASFIGELLKNAGYEVVIYEDAAAALDYVKENLSTLSMIVTDQAMPHVSGLDIAEHAKQLRGELPVVLITGFPDSAVSGTAERLGIERFLKKPFRIDDLLLAVRELADKRGTAG